MSPRSATAAKAPPPYYTPEGKKRKAQKKCPKGKFPVKLMEVLQSGENSDSISWLPHGRSFLIVSPEKFTNEVVPKYFGREIMYASFTRKLFRYGFRQIAKGPDAESFIHINFRRDHPQFARAITALQKAECRDGCPALHGGINDESLARHEANERAMYAREEAARTVVKTNAVMSASTVPPAAGYGAAAAPPLGAEFQGFVPHSLISVNDRAIMASDPECMELQAKIDAVQSRINEIRRQRLAAMNAKRLELLENEERALLREGGQVTTASGSGAGTTLVPANALSAAMAARLFVPAGDSSDYCSNAGHDRACPG